MLLEFLERSLRQPSTDWYTVYEGLARVRPRCVHVDRTHTHSTEHAFENVDKTMLTQLVPVFFVF